MNTVKTVSVIDKRYIVALMLTLSGVILFSAKGLFIKFAYQYKVDTITLLTLRMAISVPVYLLIGFYSERFHQQRISKKQILAISGFGIIGYYLASYLDMQGLQYISVSLERAILYLYPTFVLLLSVIVLKQRINKKEIAALILAYSGIIFIFSEDINTGMGNEIWGSILVALSAFAFAIFMVGSDKHISLVGSVRFTAYAMSAAGFAVFVHYLLSDRSNVFQQQQEVYFLGALLAILSTIIPSFFMAYGMKVLGAKKVSLLGVIGPVSTMMLGVIFLGETLSMVQVSGIMIVVLAVSLIVIFNKTDKDKQ